MWTKSKKHALSDVKTNKGENVSSNSTVKGKSHTQVKKKTMKNIYSSRKTQVKK